MGVGFFHNNQKDCIAPPSLSFQMQFLFIDMNMLFNVLSYENGRNILSLRNLCYALAFDLHNKFINLNISIRVCRLHPHIFFMIYKFYRESAVTFSVLKLASNSFLEINVQMIFPHSVINNLLLSRR